MSTFGAGSPAERSGDAWAAWIACISWIEPRTSQSSAEPGKSSRPRSAQSIAWPQRYSACASSANASYQRRAKERSAGSFASVRAIDHAAVTCTRGSFRSPGARWAQSVWSMSGGSQRRPLPLAVEESGPLA